MKLNIRFDSFDLERILLIFSSCHKQYLSMSGVNTTCDNYISFNMSSIFHFLSNKIPCNSSLPQKNLNRCLSFLKRKTKQQKTDNYVVNLANQTDRFTILRLMEDVYYKDEPTCASIGLRSTPLLQERARKFLSEGISFVAKCKYDNCIVGACINCSIQPWDPDCLERLACSSADEKVRSLLLFYAHVTRIADLWTCYGTNKVFEIAYIFVKPEHRRQGISTKLMQESIKLAQDCGYSVLRYDATNYRLAVVCQKLGMQLFESVPFCSYLGKNYEPIFRPPHPNDAVKIYVKAFVPLANGTND